MTEDHFFDPMLLKVGDRVRSRAVGTKPWFDGEIVEIRDHAVVLRDAERRRWLREFDELEPSR